MGINLSDDYYQVYRCGTCGKGYIGKTKDNTPGHKFSAEYLCRYCGTKSTMGKLVSSESGTDMMPSEFGTHMKMVSTDEEREVWARIWWK